jgi:ParB-like chromosome segregation protein Spo0J
MKDKTKPAEIDGILVHCAHCDLVPVGKIKPYPRNNKRHPDAQLDLLCKAIKAQGWRAPGTVSVQSGYIVRGHARYEAAKRLGLSAVPVDWQNYASDTAERADRIADNRLSELAEWDMDKLQDELIDIDAANYDIEVTGFSDSDLENLLSTSNKGDESVEHLKPIKKIHVLISMTTDQSFVLLPQIETIAQNAGAEVHHGGN